MLFTVAYYATNIKSHAPRNPHFHECMALMNPRCLSPSPAHIHECAAISKDKNAPNLLEAEKGYRQKNHPDPTDN